MRIAIVIPAYDEQDSISDVISSVRNLGDVIVVSDGSTDDTAKTSRLAGAIVIEHRNNRGYDAALATGFRYADKADYEIIISFDADGQLEASPIKGAINVLKRGEAEMVLGQRSNMPRFSEILFGVYTRLRFDVPDILCGFKAFTMSVYREHQASMEKKSVFTSLALAALRTKTKFILIPVYIRPRIGTSRFGSNWRAGWKIMMALIQAIHLDFVEQRK